MMRAVRAVILTLVAILVQAYGPTWLQNFAVGWLLLRATDRFQRWPWPGSGL
jgi:hypothetical protein